MTWCPRQPGVRRSYGYFLCNNDRLFFPKRDLDGFQTNSFALFPTTVEQNKNCSRYSTTSHTSTLLISLCTATDYTLPFLSLHYKSWLLDVSVSGSMNDFYTTKSETTLKFLFAANFPTNGGVIGDLIYCANICARGWKDYGPQRVVWLQVHDISFSRTKRSCGRWKGRWVEHTGFVPCLVLLSFCPHLLDIYPRFWVEWMRGLVGDICEMYRWDFERRR